MNAQNALLKLMTHFRAPEVVTTRTNPKTGKVTERRERAATPFYRRPDKDAVGTVAELLDTFVQANGLSIPTRDKETPAEAIIRMAAESGQFVARRAKDEPTKIVGGWLRADAPIRKRRVKGARQAAIKAAQVNALEALGMLGDTQAAPNADAPNVDDSDATQVADTDEDEDDAEDFDDDAEQDEDEDTDTDE